jgi:hypothetical protein
MSLRMGMTDKALEYCARGIIRHLNGDIEKFRYYVDRAMKLNKYICCDCGMPTINCRYGKKFAKLCTSCGILWIDGEWADIRRLYA